MVFSLPLRWHGIYFPVVYLKDLVFWFSWGSAELVSTPFSQQNVRLILNPYKTGQIVSEWWALEVMALSASQ